MPCDENSVKSTVKNTCCSLNCPFIPICKEYNFLVDRGKECKIMEFIIEKSIKIQKERKRRMKST